MVDVKVGTTVGRTVVLKVDRRVERLAVYLADPKASLKADLMVSYSVVPMAERLVYAMVEKTAALMDNWRVEL